ncbi:hypothetical protein AAAK29_18355 [Mesorhizobium sp. CCNWLW179-1]|uniref:hypothetical protein n=2 Tax=Mesorhizobium TaxID=68287 RepID=UPI003014CBE4
MDWKDCRANGQNMLVDSSYIILLILYLPLLLAIFCAASARWPITFIALALNEVLICLVLSGSFSASDDRFGLGQFIVNALILALVAIVLAGLAILLVRPARTPTPGKDGMIAVLAVAPALLLLLFGLGIFSRWRGDIVFALLVAGALFFAQQAIQRRRKAQGPLSYDLYGLACFVLAGTVGASIVFACFTAIAVHWQAAKTAASQPYCIQSGSRAAASMLDLSLLTFREPPYSRWPRFLRNHGLLVIDTGTGQRVMHWSYRKLSFQPPLMANESSSLSSRPTIVCVPS